MSALRQNGSSSASENDQRYAGLDEKKRKRMISNRESARRSRMRKQKLMQDLADEVCRLQIANNGIVGRVNEMKEKYAVLATENNVLRAQAMELTERLESLNDVIKNIGMDVDITDPLLEPWQAMCPMQPIPASSGLFKF